MLEKTRISPTPVPLERMPPLPRAAVFPVMVQCRMVACVTSRAAALLVSAVLPKKVQWSKSPGWARTPPAISVALLEATVQRVIDREFAALPL